MDTLTLRIVDLLLDDDEQLEELFIDINFQRSDNVLLLYRDRFRLADILLRLKELEAEGVITSHSTEYPADCGAVAKVFRITDLARKKCEAHLDRVSGLYELADG